MGKSGAGQGPSQGDGAAKAPPADPVKIALRHTVARQLPYFVAVAEQGNFNRAAASLNITQSALTRRIQNLETALQITLFVRGPRGVNLTDAGSVLYAEAGRLMAQIDWVVGQVTEIALGDVGRIQIALNDAASLNPRVTRALLKYRETYPAVDLHLSVMMNEEIVVALESDLIDAGFFYHMEEDPRLEDCGSILVENMNMVLAVAAGHPLATKPVVEAGDLKGEPLIWPARGRGRVFHDRLTNAVEKSGVVPHSNIHVMSTETAANLVSAGLAVSLIADIYPVPSNVVLRPLADMDESWALKMMWRNRNQRAALKAFRDIVQSEIEQPVLPRRGIRTAGRPGNPTDNAFIETVNGSLRDECLSTHGFASLPEDAQVIKGEFRAVG